MKYKYNIAITVPGTRISGTYLREFLSQAIFDGLLSKQIADRGPLSDINLNEVIISVRDKA